MYEIEELCERPRLMVLRGFLSHEECEHLIERARPKICPSTTVDPDTGEHIVVDARSSTSTYFWLRETPIITRIEERIARQINLPVENG